MVTPITRELGRFISDVRYRDIPAKAVPLIKRAFVDCIAVMIAGGQEESLRILEAALAPAPGSATILFTDRTTTSQDAALINGTAAHVLDFDDFARMGGHPSCVLVPAILAVGETLGSSGEQLLCAYAAGFETWIELLRRESDVHHHKGWHPTGIFGAIAAAAACASLRQLDAEQAAHAIALAASQSAGLAANFGSMTKSYHAGCAARAGVISAALASNGFTAGVDAIEHAAGFLMAFSPAGRIDLESPSQAGRDWKLLSNRLSIKKYPMCFATHRALDGMLDLLRDKQIEASDVMAIRVSFSRRSALVLRYHQARTALEGKFSIEFAMACAVIGRRAGLRELNDEFVRRPDIQSLMQRVATEVLGDDMADPNLPGFSKYDRVIVETNSGEVLDSGPISSVRGDPDSPLSDEELWNKFEDCVQSAKATVSARALFDSLMSLERMRAVSDIPGLGRHP